MLRVDLERRELSRRRARPATRRCRGSHSTTCSHRRRVAHRLVRDLAHRHDACRAGRSGSRRRRPSPPSPRSRCSDRRRREPGEDRHLHRADVRARVRRDRDRRRHRHEDRHAVAGLDAERDERLGEPRHLRRELGERPRAPVAVLAAEHGGARIGRAPRPVVDARPGNVESRRRRTTSPTRGRRTCRARAPTAARTRCRGRRRPRARTCPARRPRQRCSSW